MSSSTDWRSSVTAMERFTNVQKIGKNTQHTALKASGFTLENDAYLSSSSKACAQLYLEDYDAACLLLSKPVSGNASIHGAIIDPDEQNEQDDGPHEVAKIGSYAQCRYVASGVTADVYKSGVKALKVITETKDMQPHDHIRESKILALLKKPCIPLLETFYDQHQRFVLVFPYMPLNLAEVLERGAVSPKQLRSYFIDIFSGLADIHGKGIIHRDIKPSAILLESIDGPAYLSDFGTAWHPELAQPVEPADQKILDIGTGPYRAPEALFGNQSYGPSVDMWAAGAMLAECARDKPTPLFESRPAHEDGSQLGLILSIFKTIGTPTHETWPEASSFKTPPFEMYRVFEPKKWEDILPEVDLQIRQLVANLVKYDGTRFTAEQALAEVRTLRDQPQ